MPESAKKLVFLVEKGVSSEKMTEIQKEAARERAAGAAVLVAGMNKNKKFQKEQLAGEGWTEFREFFAR